MPPAGIQQFTMKKQICGLLVVALLLPCLLLGCGEMTPDDGKLTIVTTIFPAYDWVRQIAGDRDDINIVLLPGNGVDMHAYQPTVDDIITLTSCDLLVHVGGVDDAWIEKALANAVAPTPHVINLMDVLGDGVKKEEVIAEMEHEHEEFEACSDEAHDHKTVTTNTDDEHVWLSLKNASLFCSAIAEALSALDADHATEYNDHAKAYKESLDSMDAAYRLMVDRAPRRTLVFADRFPFRYLLDDYHLTYYAAFAGCSADTNASFETVAFLAEQIDRLHLPCVIVVKNSPVNIAAGLIQSTQEKNQIVLTLNAMQSMTAADAAGGMTYLTIMQQNLDVLSSALN